MLPEVRFATSRDGVRLAWSQHGEGPPLVRVGTWLTHLQYDWESVVWRHWLIELGDRFTFVRYDDRGCGLSDREVSRLGMEAWVEDLEAVVDATGHARVALFGMSQGAAIAVAYAARHPDRVSHLVCLGGYPRGGALRERTREEQEEAEALNTLARIGWGRADPTFRRIFTGALIPVGRTHKCGGSMNSNASRRVALWRHGSCEPGAGSTSRGLRAPSPPPRSSSTSAMTRWSNSSEAESSPP